MSAAQLVLADWKAGLAHVGYWWRFGLLDIKLRYRRTVLGPFWVTISFAVSAAALTIVYSTLFGISARSFFAYLISGLAIWGLIGGLVTEGCMTFINCAHMIQEHRLPLLSHALRTVVVGFLVFLHNLLVAVAAVLLFGVGVGWATLLTLPGLALVLFNGLWVAVLLGMLCARFRDLPQIVGVLVTVSFFVTPVFWYKTQLGSRAYIADLNPLYAFLELVRSPLLGQLPPARSVLIAALVTVVGWAATLVFATRFQRKLTYWL